MLIMSASRLWIRKLSNEPPCRSRYSNRAQNYVTVVHGKQSERTVFALEKFTIPDDKQLVIEIAEKEGGRHQSFVVENEDIVRANVIDELSIQ